ncbi:hypothetical protein FS837_002326, partial [Tulasnella sp. UAMH 9824]
IIGSLMYASISTRPDITYATNKLAQFSVNPTEQHMVAAKHVLRYLAGTRNLCLQYSKSGPLHTYSKAIGYNPKDEARPEEGKDDSIEAFCDSDQSGDPNDYKSTTGYCYKLAGGVICWNSRKQEVTALSSVEAEYMASTETAKQAQWLYKLFEELNFTYESIPVYIDNKGALALHDNPTNHRQTRHIQTRWHFVVEAIENGFIKTFYIPSGEQVADILTKPLGTILFERHRTSLGLINKCFDKGEC